MTPLLVLFILVTPLREVTNYSPIVNDIQSQLPPDHDYGLSVHEGTHGINGRLRMLYRKPCFYVLNNRAVTMSEPQGTIKEVARVVTRSLRGPDYQHYLVYAQTWWNNQPTYVFDEFVAYTNGSQAHKELGTPVGDITVRRMAEFISYSVCVPMATGSNDPKMKAFLRWQISRAMELGAREYLDLSNPDCENFVKFLHQYFGPVWTLRNFGV